MFRVPRQTKSGQDEPCRRENGGHPNIGLIPQTLFNFGGWIRSHDDQGIARRRDEWQSQTSREPVLPTWDLRRIET